MLLHDLARQEETKPHSGDVPACLVSTAPELGEDVFQIIGSNPRPSVLHGNPHRSVDRRRAESHRRPVRSVLRRVRQQVPQDLADARRVCQYPDIRGWLNNEVMVRQQRPA